LTPKPDFLSGVIINMIKNLSQKIGIKKKESR